MIYKSHIDGLRALSIISVIIYHAFPSMLTGGYLGVDFFFVISGYLITGILFEKIQGGKPFLLNFYARRIKRLFPALILVFIFCYVAGWFSLIASEYKELNHHILWATGFLSNFRLLFDVEYFDRSSELKPLLHLWSLAIEEQFYVVWPIFLYFLFKKSKLLMGMAGFTIASLVLCLCVQYINPTANFYLPFTRFWELSIGGILFIFEQKKLSNNAAKPSKLLFWALIVFTFVPLFLFNEQTIFPGFSSLWPLSCFLFLFYQTNKNNFPLWNKFLCSRSMSFIGKISFPLYLWHWPLLSFAIIIFPERATLITVFAIAIAFFLSIATYLLFEKPVRQMSDLIALPLIFLMIFIAGLAYSAYSRGGLEFRYQKLISIPESFKRDFTKWENKGMQPEGDCRFPFYFPNKKICVNDDNALSPSVMLVGDSHAYSAYWGIQSQLKLAGHHVGLSGKGACLPFMNLTIREISSSCKTIIDNQIKQIVSQASIRYVIFSHRYAYLSDQASQESFDQFELSMAHTFDLLIQANKKIIYMMPIPELRFEPRLCIGDLPFGRNRPNGDCSYLLSDELKKQSKVRESIFKVLKSRPEIQIYEPYDFICPEGKCSVLIDGKIIYMDDNHLSESGSLLQAINMKNKISFTK